MVEKRDYYEVLGVVRTATTDEIKQAYRKLAKAHHPDISENRSEAEVKFREINEAYAVLSDSDKRAHYDRFGHQQPGGMGAGGADFSGFGDIFGGLGDIFDMFFDMRGGGGGGGRGGRPRPQRGPDIRQMVEVTLEQAFAGAEIEVKIQPTQECTTCKGSRMKPGSSPETCRQCGGSGVVRQVVRTSFGQMVRTGACPVCNGQGQMIRDVCEACSGKGRTIVDRTLQVKVPPGVDTGQWIRIEGAGHAGALGGPPGDLYLAVNVKPHATITREGDDLFTQLRITFTDAALGSETEVKTLEGSIKLKVNAGTQSGQEFKVKGKGMPVLQGYGRGDLYVKIQVMTPTSLNDKQKKLLREFAAAGSQEAEEHKGFFQKVLDAILG
ncbi:MAG: molecular chaperone DnaJ [Candidatus Xenobia bacterium]